MSNNPLLEHGPLGYYERLRRRAENVPDPFAEANALLQQTQADNMAFAAEIREQAQREEAERQARQRETVANQVAGFVNTSTALVNPLINTTPKQQPEVVVNDNAIPDKDIFGNDILFDKTVLLESKSTNDLFTQFLKTNPRIEELSRKGRKDYVEEHFPQFLQDVYSLRGTPEKAPNAVQRREMLSFIYGSNPALFEGDTTGIVADTASTVAAGVAGGLSQLVNQGTHLVRRGFNQAQTALGLQTEDEHLADLRDEVARQQAWSDGIRRFRDTVLTEDALDSLKQYDEAEGFADSVASVVESPLSALYYLSEMAGVGGAGGAALKGSAKAAGIAASRAPGATRVADAVAKATAPMRGSIAAKTFARWGNNAVARTASNVASGAVSPGMLAFYTYGGGLEAESVYRDAATRGINIDDVHDNALAAALTNMAITAAGGAITRTFGVTDVERALTFGARKSASKGASTVVPGSIEQVEVSVADAVKNGINRAMSRTGTAASPEVASALQGGATKVVEESSKFVRGAKKVGAVTKAMGSILAAGGAEGAEEFLAGMAGAMATAGMDENGNFSKDNISEAAWAKIYQQAWKESAMGFVLGVGTGAVSRTLDTRTSSDNTYVGVPVTDDAPSNIGLPAEEQAAVDAYIAQDAERRQPTVINPLIQPEVTDPVQAREDFWETADLEATVPNPSPVLSQEEQLVADSLDAPPIDYNIDGVTPETETLLAGALTERIENGKSLMQLAMENEVDLFKLAQSLVKKIVESGSLEDYAEDLNDFYQYVSDFDVSRLAIANWVLGKFSVPLATREQLARAMVTTPAFNEVLTTASHAVLPYIAPHNTKRRREAVNVLLTAPRGKPEQGSGVAAQLEGSGFDQDIYDAIQSLPDVHPLKQAIRDTQPEDYSAAYSRDLVYSLLTGDNTTAMPRSLLPKMNRLVRDSDMARALLDRVYRQTVSRLTDPTTGGVAPNSLSLRSDYVNTAITQALQSDEAPDSMGFKHKNQSYEQRLRDIAQFALESAKAAVAQEASQAKKNSALSKEAQKLGLEPRVRGGKRSPERALEAAKAARIDHKSKRLPFENLTPKGQRNAVQQSVAAYIREVASRNWDAAIAQRVRVVSPDMIPDGDSLNGFTRVNENYIYVVAHPDMDADLINWTIGHEAAHLGMTLRRANGTDIFSGEQYNALLEHVSTNPMVQALMEAIRAHYPKADHILLAEEAMAELTAAQLTGRWSNIYDKWGVNVPARYRGANTKLGKLLGRFRDLISRIIRAFSGNNRATDADIMAYISRVARNAHTSGVTGDLVRYYPEQMGQAHDAYSQFAAETHADWDSNSDKDASLATIAERNGNPDMATWYRASMRPPPPPRLPNGEPEIKKVKGKISDLRKAQAAAEDFLNTEAMLKAQADSAREQPREVQPSADVALFFYDATAPNGVKSQVRRGAVIPFAERNEVLVRYAMYDDVATFHADRKVLYRLNPGETFEELKRRAEADVIAQGFDLRDAVSRIQSATDEGQLLDNFSQMAMGRITRWELFSPTFTKVAMAVRRVLPDVAEPILDTILDTLHYGKALFLSPEDIIQSVENAYNAYASGDNSLTKLNQYLHLQALRGNLQKQFTRFGISDGPTFMDHKTEFANEIRKYRDVVTREDVERFFHAKEAQIRDVEIAKRMGVDPNNHNIERLYMPGQPQNTLSGFFTGDGKHGDWMAKEYFATEFAAFSPEKKQALEALADKYMNIVRHTQALMYMNGILDHDEYFAAKERPFWVSLRDTNERKGRVPSPAGRFSRPENLIETSIDIMQTNIRASYNQHMYQRIAKIAMLTPNNDYFEVLPLDVARVGEGAYDFEYLVDEDAASSDRYTRTVKLEDGTFVRLRFKGAGRELLKPTHNTNRVVQGIQHMTSYLGMFKTSLSPSFVVVSGPRDALTTFLNIQGAIGEDLLSSRDATRVAMDAIKYGIQYYTKLVKAGLNQDFKSDPFINLYHSEGAGLAFGAQVGFDEVSREISSAFNSNSDGTFGRQINALTDKAREAFKRGVQGISFAPEQMFRIGAMRAYMEHFNRTGQLKIDDWDNPIHMRDALNENVTLRERLIQATKDITTNFERKGTARSVRAFYMFFNAAMQGMFRTVPQIMASEHGRRYVMILGGLMFMQAMMAISSMGDDEDGESKYFRLRGRDRKRWISEDVSLPLSPDMGWLAAIADSAAGVALGKRSILDASGDIVGAAGRAAVPLNWWQTDSTLKNVVGGLAPSVTIPVLADMMDTNYFGNKLVREKVYDPVTGQQIASPTNLEASPSNSSDAGMAIAQALSRIGLDKSGAEVDVWMDSALGGLWQVLSRTQRNQAEGGTVVDAAFKAVFTGYQMKPNMFAVKDTADAIASHAAQLSRKLVPSGQKVNLTDTERKDYAKYQEILHVAERARKQAKALRGPHGKVADVWALYKRAKEEGDFTTAAMYKDEYDQLAGMQDKVYALITLKAKELGVYDALKD